MNTKIKTSGINFKTVVSLSIFSITIVLVIFISQNILLKISYERYQLKNIKSMISSISEEEGDINSVLESLAYENSVCIEYYTDNGDVFDYNTLMVGCGLNKKNDQLQKLMEKMASSSDEVIQEELSSSFSDTKAVLSGIRLSSGYVYIYSTLEDVDNTSTLFKGQIVYITIVVIIIACFISYFLSIKITEPIIKITKQAKEMGEGKYDVKFESSDVLEINELASTLNYVELELSKIDELRRDLMANVSHDLKTPLTMIRAYAEKVRDISYKDKDKMDKDLNIIIEETERLNVLVNDILELSKMQAQANDMHIEEFDLVELINEVISRYEILTTTEDYKFVLELPTEALVKADKNKIHQAVYNLVNNAINYTGSDKVVTIKVIESKKDYTVEIIDTGKGIKKDEIPYIWDKYYKSDKNHQRNVVSTGLGLSIVKNIFVMHKFDYGVKSTPKKGTTFYFKIKK